MFSPQSYEEELMIVCSDALPYDSWPMIIVQTGARAYGNFNPLTKYEYVGIHLMDAKNVLSFPSTRTTLPFFLQCFNAEEQPVDSDGEVRCIFSSYEWWNFIRIMTEEDNLKAPVSLLDCIFLPAMFETSVFRALQPLLCQMVTSRNARAITRKMDEALANINQGINSLISARTFYFRYYQYKRLCEEGEYEWSYPMLLTQASPLAQQVCACTDDKAFWKDARGPFLEDARRLYDTTEELSLVSDLRPNIPYSVIAQADDLVREYRRTTF